MRHRQQVQAAGRHITNVHGKCGEWLVHQPDSSLQASHSLAHRGLLIISAAALADPRHSLLITAQTPHSPTAVACYGCCLFASSLLLLLLLLH